MRVALVRGPNLNPWELSNFELVEGVCAIGSRSAVQPLGGSIPVRRLPSPADLLHRAPGLLAAGVVRFSGSPDYLLGLEGALSNFDIAHVAELSNPYSLQAIKARRAGRCRRVVATVWENIALPAPANRFAGSRARQVADGIDACIAITDDARLHLELAGVPPERIAVLPMGIDLERFTPSPSPRRPALHVLSVSRLVSEKGVEDLVIALRLLADRGVEARLTLVGTGPLEGRVRSMASALDVTDRVELTGPLPYERIPLLLADSDVFVLASAPRATWREQFGFAVVEAMASGRPVLVGDSGSLAEVVGDASALVTPHSPSNLADRLEELAGDDARRAELGARNRAWAEERYDRRVAARRLEALYERVLAAAPRA